MPKHLQPWQAEKMIRTVEMQLRELHQSLQRAYLERDAAKERVWEVAPTAKLNSLEWESSMGALDRAEKQIATLGRLIVNRERKIRNLEPIAFPRREAAVALESKP